MALRPMARIVLARRYCAQQPCFNAASPLFVLSTLSVWHSPNVTCARLSLSTNSQSAAKVDTPLDHDVPPPQPTPQERKRPVKIGPLPNGPVDEGTIRRIFGNSVSAVQGNHVLRILHHRRTSGSLADYGVDNLGQQHAHVSRFLAIKALDWLRATFPIDEARAAEEWAEKEANRIAYELWLADPENDSKYKDPARVFREQQKKEQADQTDQKTMHEWQEPSQKIGMLHVGPSQFERNIAEKRRLRLEEVTKKAEEKEAREKEHEVKLATGEWVRTPGGTQLMKPGQTAYVDIFGREQVSRRKEEMEKYQKKAQTDFKNEAEMLSKTTLVGALPSCLGIEVLNNMIGTTPLPNVRLRPCSLPHLVWLRPLLHSPFPRVPPLARP
jgi:rhomboid-like protein